MKTFELKAEARKELGKKSTKELRKEDRVPCVLYGNDHLVHFSLTQKELKDVVYTAASYLLKIEVDGTVYDAIIKDHQFHPVTDKLIHMDFLSISIDAPFEISVPVNIFGLSQGVLAGGKQQTNMRSLRVKALAKDLPDSLDIDITEVDLGHSVKVGSLSYPNLELLDSSNAVVCAVKLTRAARGLASDGDEGVEGSSEETTEETAAE